MSKLNDDDAVLTLMEGEYPYPDEGDSPGYAATGSPSSSPTTRRRQPDSAEPLRKKQIRSVIGSIYGPSASSTALVPHDSQQLPAEQGPYPSTALQRPVPVQRQPIQEHDLRKIGCHLPNKQASSLLQALMSQWIRVWGPMHTLCSDQEGGLSSSEATVFCERLGITRTFVGTSAYHSKGLVERHIALTKHSMMILKSTSTKEGLHLSYDDLIHEVTMSQNMLLEKGGVTPQTAVTGINPREFWQMDNEQLQAHTGALDVKADFAEQAIRGRLLAKQAILEAVVGERLAIARRTKQQKHDLSLLIAGMAIDIYRQPHRKDDFGWHGPAELVSVNRHSGTAIVVHQGQPLILPLNHIRKHVALDYFIHYYTSDTHIMDYDPRGCNETYAADEIFTQRDYKQLQQLVDSMPPGKCIWIGYKVREDNTGVWEPLLSDFLQHPIYVAVIKSELHQYLGQVHGILYGTNLRRIACPRQHAQGVLFRWIDHSQNNTKYNSSDSNTPRR